MERNPYNDLLEMSLRNPKCGIFFDGIRGVLNYPDGYYITGVIKDCYVKAKGKVWFAAGDYDTASKIIVMDKMVGLSNICSLTDHDVDLLWRNILPWKECIRVIVKRVGE